MVAKKYIVNILFWLFIGSAFFSLNSGKALAQETCGQQAITQNIIN
jgi:hypothetical protein